EVVSGSGSVTPSSVVTGSDGAAEAAWTLGAEAGAQEVVAFATAVSTRVEARFVATATPGPFGQAAIVAGSAQQGRAGEPLVEEATVRALDSHGNPVQGVEVRFRVVTGHGTFARAMMLTDAAGMARSRWTLGNSALTRQEAVALVL